MREYLARTKLAVRMLIVACIFIQRVLLEPKSGRHAKPDGLAADESTLKVDALLEAEKAVKLCLKHPLDAHFPFFGSDIRTDKLNSKFVVTGTVEGKNDFGGSLTSAYEVRFTNQSGKLRTDPSRD